MRNLNYSVFYLPVTLDFREMQRTQIDSGETTADLMHLDSSTVKESETFTT